MYGCNGLALPMPDSLALDPRDRGGLQQPMLIARDLRKHFPVKGSGGKSVQAVDGVSFTVGKGETLGVVGESGCGNPPLPGSCCIFSSPTLASWCSTANRSASYPGLPWM